MVTTNTNGTDHETNEAAEFFNTSGKTMRTFLFALVSTANGDLKLVGPASKPELRTEIEKLGEVTIQKMIRGREVDFSVKKTISFS